MPVDQPPTRQLDSDRCYRIASSRDGRFDGMFVTAVLTTHIYCRPSCPAVTPRRRNVRFYPTPAAAQDAGFRACKRCRPDAAPGSPEWDSRADAVARSVRLIGDGLIEREGVGGLARRVGYSPRHLSRLLASELGTGPLRLAMAHRVQTARSLLETSDLPITDVAWAAGFKSIRQFNDLFRQVYDQTPGDLRRRAAGGAPRPPVAPGLPSPAGVIRARLVYRPPLDAAALLSFLGARAVPGVERFDGTTYTTSLRLPRGCAVASVRDPAGAGREPAAADPAETRPAETRPARAPYLECELSLDDVRDYAAAISRLRRLLDLDADPVAVASILGSDPVLAPLVAESPGRRMPGTTDVHELAVRAVVGQQVTVASARVTLGRLAERFGEPLNSTGAGVDRTFPTAEALAGARPEDIPLPRQRARALHHLAAALAGGDIELHPGSDRDRAQAALLSQPGVGPWTAAYIRMRGLGDPDVLPPGDAALRRVLGRQVVGRPALGRDPAPVAVCTEGWKPWRSYATAHLWAAAAGPAAAGPAMGTGRDGAGRR